MTSQPIILEFTYQADVDAVWKAITDPAQMRRWFFEQIKDFQPRVGFETTFEIEHQGKHFLHMWKITGAIPGKRLNYGWRYAGYDGDSSVTWDLISGTNRTTLRLTIEGIESFPQTIPEFTRDSCIQGWTFLLEKRLREFLTAEYGEKSVG